MSGRKSRIRGEEDRMKMGDIKSSGVEGEGEEVRGGSKNTL